MSPAANVQLATHFTTRSTVASCTLRLRLAGPHEANRVRGALPIRLGQLGQSRSGEEVGEFGPGRLPAVGFQLCGDVGVFAGIRQAGDVELQPVLPPALSNEPRLFPRFRRTGVEPSVVRGEPTAGPAQSIDVVQ